MKIFDYRDRIKGWFVGDFFPTRLKTGRCQVAYKRYKAGDCDKRHVHKIATQVTVIISGMVKMNGRQYDQGQVLVISPGQRTDFLAVSDRQTIVVKVPGAKNDKYEVDSTQG